MIVSAVMAGLPSATCAASGVSTLPPALASMVLNQTVAPSYCAPWISIRCGLPALASLIESLIISVQVAGGVLTTAEYSHSRALGGPRAARGGDAYQDVVA